ncbi:hypothetical protein FIBSPDRAFT_442236 [Athelia psychrophila]|uniref:Uncharacterized protein n=1 Tax=Athelia psychrophila TaxID=1759441 RepID=A0A166MHJ9_9AGAM|nr:hypothetical protein FIBSPDRAFT_442236 [Fibularhizoctonia sp. CBS 109695]
MGDFGFQISDSDRAIFNLDLLLSSPLEVHDNSYHAIAFRMGAKSNGSSRSKWNYLSSQPGQDPPPGSIASRLDSGT